MRLEHFPILLAVVVGLIGFALLYDAWAPEDHVADERRRRTRRPRSRSGEALVGFGVLAMAAAFMGRDTWRYSTLTVIAGALLLLVGAFKSRAYLRDVVRRRAK